MRRSAGAALAALAATVLVLAGVSAPASAAALPMTLSSSYGPSGGGNTIIGTVTPSTAVPAPFPAGTIPTVQFQYIGTGSTACSAMARTDVLIAGTGTTNTAGVLTVDSNSVRRMTSAKIVFPVPSGVGDLTNPTGLVLVGTQAQAKWSVCVYDSPSTTASTLIASSSYTVVLKPTITSISPASSPAGGGQLITVVGTGFTAVGSTTVTASIGGVALTNIKVASDGNSFTGTTGPRAPGTSLYLTVVAPGGTVVSSDPDNNPGTNNPIAMSYTNGISISPTTGASGTYVTIDVHGAGFSADTFDVSGTPTSTGAHVFLVQGAYDKATNRGVAECIVGAVVSDNELVCDLDLSANQLNPTTSATVPGTPIADGAYILTVVSNGATNAVTPNPSIISSGAAFVVGPY